MTLWRKYSSNWRENHANTSSEKTIENLTSMLYKNEASDYESEYYLTKIKFNDDTRIKEANRILSSTRILKANSIKAIKINPPSRTGTGSRFIKNKLIQIIEMKLSIVLIVY